MSRLLQCFSFDLICQEELGIVSPKETGMTFIENALIKARSTASQANAPTLADDSGLCVPALGLQPGILSARYAADSNNPPCSQANIHKLLAAMRGFTGKERRAFFYCVLVLLRNYRDAVPMITEASWWGTIAESQQGQGGFGYDPVFIADEHPDLTIAQLSPEHKNSVSHRGKALMKLVKKLERERRS